MARGNAKILYQERLLSIVNIIMFTIAIGVLVFAMFFHSSTQPNVITYGLLAALILAGLNFSKLSIDITNTAVAVSYGIFTQIVPWNQIESAEIDPVPGVGWLIQMSSYRGRHRLGYHVFGKPKIKITVKQGWFCELSFSTKYPRHIMEIITGDGTGTRGKIKPR
jgi:hypothetical protein